MWGNWGCMWWRIRVVAGRVMYVMVCGAMGVIVCGVLAMEVRGVAHNNWLFGLW